MFETMIETVRRKFAINMYLIIFGSEWTNIFAQNNCKQHRVKFFFGNWTLQSQFNPSIGSNIHFISNTANCIF